MIHAEGHHPKSLAYNAAESMLEATSVHDVGKGGHGCNEKRCRVQRGQAAES